MRAEPAAWGESGSFIVPDSRVAVDSRFDPNDRGAARAGDRFKRHQQRPPNLMAACSLGDEQALNLAHQG